MIFIFREEFTQRKIDKMIVEAKAKMAKGDKKGKDGYIYSTQKYSTVNLASD
jgi:hypothetical protein